MPARRRGWIEDARGVPLPDVAAALGLNVHRRGGRISLECPGCGADRRGRTDPRGAAGLTADGAGWRCHRCGAGGDGLDLAALKLTGSATPATWEPIRDFYEHLQAPSPGPLAGSQAPRRPSPVPSPSRLAHDAAEAAWAACEPVTADAGVAAWLGSRGLDPAKVEDRDLARALPRDATVPAWARCHGRPWTAGWRCILPAWDAAGRLAGLRARWCGEGEPPGGVKETAPAGVTSGGLVYADPLAILILRAGAVPDWWGAPPLDVLVAEGGPDFLSVATLWGDAAELAPAIFGLWPGAWTPEIASRVPDAATVTVWTDPDESGDRYAEQVRQTLAQRCKVLRFQPGKETHAHGR